MTEDVKWLIALSEVKGVGATNARNLVARMGSAEAVMRESVLSLAKVEGVTKSVLAGFEQTRDEALRIADAEMNFMERNGIEALPYYSKHYPFLLQKGPDSMPVVYYQKGDTDLGKSNKVLSIVGTRRPTEQGREVCEKIVSELAAKYPDLLIVSGLAYGIDICAQRQALRCGLKTIGVVAHGLQTIYPSMHRDVAMQMMTGSGAVLTEFRSGTQPDPQNFVIRNRTVAGMADATLVIESGKRGGSLITAEYASQMGREVFAVPGRVGDEMSQGCNMLIKNRQARLVQSASDIEEALGWQPLGSGKPVQGDLFSIPVTEEEQAVFDMLVSEGETSVSALSVKCHLPVSKLNAMLLNMEFAGIVKMLPGNNYKAIR